MEVFLYNSTICRLCGEENDNGSFLYSAEENRQSLNELINTYLPIKVNDDGQLPRTVCPGCTIQVEATVEFINLIINGQKIIRELYIREKEYKKTLGQGQQAVSVLDSINVKNDTSNEIYLPDHPASLRIEGLDRPKRKRGRPKKQKTENDSTQESDVKENLVEISEPNPELSQNNEETPGKRRRKVPTRFSEAVQGKELEKIFIEEGVIDKEESETDKKTENVLNQKIKLPKEPEVIGHLETGELVVVVKGKGRGRTKGRTRTTCEECAICGMKFSSIGRYMSHVALHGPVLYQCTQCQQKFPTKLEFTNHQNETEHSGRNVIPCKRSDDVIEVAPGNLVATEDSSTEVVVTEAGQLPTLDSPTDTSLTLNNNTRLSTELLNGSKDVKEEEALNEDKSIKTEDELKPKIKLEEQQDVKSDSDSEVVTEKGKTKIKCNHCDRLFNNRQSKSLHIKAIHLGERPYACGECGASFSYPRSLALHAISHRRLSSAKGFACDLCGKVLNHPSSVVYHKAAAHAGLRYVCGKCGRAFRHRQLLQRHQLVHDQQRPFSCKICKSSFKTKASLLNHSLLHSGVKKFSCDTCGAKFAHKTSLTLHIRWHTGIKPYGCNTCGKRFSQKGNLSEHIRIHTGEKPYACNECPRKFTTSSQRRLHAARHAAEKNKTADPGPEPPQPPAARLPCGSCARSFPSAGSLRAHARRHARGGRDHHQQIHKQISLLVSSENQPAPPSPITEEVNVETEEETVTIVQTSPERDAEENVIYVAYDVDNPEDTAYQILDPEQVVALDSPSEYSPPEEESVSVTDMSGRPLQLAMADGSRLAITSADGRTLQVVTEDGQTIPVEINGYSEEEESEPATPIVHQLEVQKNSEDEVTTYFTIV